MMYRKEEYDTSLELNQIIAAKLNKYFECSRVILNDSETYQTDGHFIDFGVKYPLEMKRRVNDNLISTYAHTGYYKYPTYQIPSGFSVEKARTDLVFFIAYDNNMRGALIFTSEAINFEKSRYVRMNCLENDKRVYKYVKMYEVNLDKCEIIKL